MRSEQSKVNILLVDDRPEGIIALEAVLRQPRFNLIHANSGREALGKILAHDFAVILMDVQMPDMNGFETVRVIKQREKSKDIPVIFLTAINKEEDFVRRGYESGAVDYMCKPFDPVALLSKVVIFVELYEKTQKIKQQSELLQQAEMRERGRQLASLQLESLNRYRHLADAIPHIVWKLAPDGGLEYCNLLWVTYSGLSLDQSSGTGWQSAVHPDDLTKLLGLAKAASSYLRDEGFETECRLRQASDGSFRCHIVKAVPEFSSNGQVEAWVVTNTDIEDRKRMEMDLIQAKEESLSASEAKSAFLANMSHEIRTPLGIVLGFSELLAQPEFSEADRRNYLDTIRRNGDLLSRLIGDVLDLSKIEAGHLPVERAKLHFPEFLNTLKFSFEQMAEAKNIQFRMSLEGPIPTFIHSDAMRLRQVLLNIVGNAVKFTERGEVLLQVRVEPDERGENYLEVSVHDQGIGISPAQARNLFQPFMQADPSTVRRYGGTGLGLSLSRKLARILGGDVTLADSRIGEGSTFLIRVPTGSLAGIEMTNQIAPQKVHHDIDFKSEQDRLKGMKILVVDDAMENQILLSKFLGNAGATVEVADNGREAVNKALSCEIDLILMDIQMPILDGYQATRELRSRSFDKPILALTAYALKEEYDRSAAAGCNDHLTKPINRVELLKHVSKFAPAVTPN